MRVTLASQQRLQYGTGRDTHHLRGHRGELEVGIKTFCSRLTMRARSATTVLRWRVRSRSSRCAVGGTKLARDSARAQQLG
jgi:hypothetical protein